jgi:hypothetical protein
VISNEKLNEMEKTMKKEKEEYELKINELKGLNEILLSEFETINLKFDKLSSYESLDSQASMNSLINESVNENSELNLSNISNENKYQELRKTIKYLRDEKKEIERKLYKRDLEYKIIEQRYESMVGEKEILTLKYNEEKKNNQTNEIENEKKVLKKEIQELLIFKETNYFLKNEIEEIKNENIILNKKNK